MSNFATLWHETATTSLGFYWMALWAFVLGYIIPGFFAKIIRVSRDQPG